jgi:Na+-translocating ferredoxin:NAD+ oxidoreductase RnfA subunit
MSEIALFSILAAFSMNLILHTGLGIKEIYQDVHSDFRKSMLRWVSLFVVVFLLWLLWTFVFSPLSLGFFDVIFIFPFCALVFYAIDEYIQKQPPRGNAHKNDNTITPSAPLCVFSLFMTLRLASTVAQAVLLSLFFSVGCVLAALTLSSIQFCTRSDPVNKKIAGIPLVIMSNGLLALLFSAAATILLRQ